MFMKAKPIRTYSLTAFLLTGAMTVYASEDPSPERSMPEKRALETKASAHSYIAHRTHFCNEENPNGGKSLLEALNAANSDSQRTIDKLKAEINEHSAFVTILDSTVKAKTVHFDSLDKLAKGTGNEQAVIQNFNQALNTAVLLSAVQSITETTQEKFDPEAFKISMCEKLKDTRACGLFTQYFSSNRTSLNFLAEAYGMAKDKTNLRMHLSNHLKVKPILTPQMMSTLMKDNPKLSSFMQQTDAEEMMSCLDSENKSRSARECQTVLAKDENKKLIEAVKKEGQQLQETLAPLTNEIQASLAQSHAELASQQKLISENAKASADKDQKLKKAYAEETLKCRNQVNAIIKNSHRRNEMLESCNVAKNKEDVDAYLRNVSITLVKLKNAQAANNYRDIEHVKAYLLKKYLCQCAKDKQVKLVDQSTCYNVSDVSAVDTVLALEGNVGKAIDSMRFGVGFTLEDKCASAPIEVVKACEREIPGDGMKRACAIANSEKVVAQKNENRDREWKKITDENYVRRDPSTKRGYTLTPKKKTWELVAEGMAPVIPSIVPVWFSNFQIKQNINMLTQQALAEKQYYHNIDIYNKSPWMYGYPYFQGNFFPTGATGTTGQTTSNPGYNFGNPFTTP